MGNTKVKSTIDTPACHPKLLTAYEAACKVSEDGLHSENFQTLFTTRPKLGLLLFSYLVKKAQELELTNADVLPRHAYLECAQHVLNTNPGPDQIELYLAVFSNSREIFNRNDVVSLLSALCSTEWNSFGGWFTELSPDDISIASLTSSLVRKEETVTRSSLVTHLSELLPDLCSSVHSYVCAALTNSQHPCVEKAMVCSLDSPPAILTDSSVFTPAILWSLSCSLSAHFVSTVEQSSSLHMVVSGECWHLLYNSDRDGLSPNRFIHHVLSYKDTTILLLSFGEHTYCAAIDQAWRDSTETWGSPSSQVIELHPHFSHQTTGQSTIYCNLSNRSAPKGLTIGRGTTKISIDSDFEKVRLKGIEYKLQVVEVWGCGGDQAIQSLRSQQQWEKKETEKAKNRKLKLDDWKDNPDKELLNMGGITTEHAER